MADEPAPGPADGSSQAAPDEHRSLRERYSAARKRTDDVVHRAQDRFERERRHRRWVDTVWGALVRMQRRGGPLLCGGLAYRIFLWELPAALFAVSLAGLFVDLSTFTVDQLARDLGLSAALAGAIGQAVSQTERSTWWLLLLSAWLMLLAAHSGVNALRLIHRIAWEEDRPPRSRTLASALVFTGVLAGGVAVSLATEHLDPSGAIPTIGVWLLILVGTFALATFAMSLLPRAGRPWPVVLPGAALFAVVLRAMALATRVYFAGKVDRVDDLYGSLGIAIVILLWLYLLAWGWIAATFINAGLAGVRDDTTRSAAQATPSAGPPASE